MDFVAEIPLKQLIPLVIVILGAIFLLGSGFDDRRKK